MSKTFLDNSFLYGANTVYIEELYSQFQNNPSSVSTEWQEFFNTCPGFLTSPEWIKKSKKIIGVEASDVIVSKTKPDLLKKEALPAEKNNNELKSLLFYRTYGHLLAKLDPLGLEKLKTLEQIGLNPELKNENLEKIYCGSIGVEFSHINNAKIEDFLYQKFEEIQNSFKLNSEEQKNILKSLVEVEGFEQYLHKKFPGAKRFSVEGADTSIVASEYAIDEISKNNGVEVVIGMAHRGRLNTLTKVMGKPYRALLAEFMGKLSFPEELGVAGDVKYHMGYSNELTTFSNNKIHLSLTPNPSHLEAVNPVVAGRVRAKQDIIGDFNRDKVMAFLIHGNAAFCGQGVVAECLMMSPLQPYDVGGVFHLVINNQVGFTANPSDGALKSRYSTDFAKIIGAPIIHVNGDDVEAVVKAVKLASIYRSTFKQDVVVEIFCYRKYGHNEGDEPMYTQPVMYNVIKEKQTPAEIYALKLEKLNIIKAGDYAESKEKFRKFLEEEYNAAKDYVPQASLLEGVWAGYERNLSDAYNKFSTGVGEDVLKGLLSKLCTVPSDFKVNSKLTKLFENRINDATKNGIVDWAAAEQLAFASLIDSGYSVRITGQDAGRGTFSHRHSVLFDQNNGSKYTPLNNLSSTAGKYEVADSNLSEYGVLGFEFGYSLSRPNALTIWEAQFGDFVNGAQIIIDQFISASETKWLRISGLVMLLPHSYEGQGPEHSSAKIERFLQLCAEDNMQVVYPTTPASIFHLLRRQLVTKVRKPLIIFSPKSILRNELAVSSIKELAENTKFNPVIGEIDNLDYSKVSKVIICSGKIYYDLLAARRKASKTDTAIIRLEQLYPFPQNELKEELAKFGNTQLIWCQEEPANMGAWEYINSRQQEFFKNYGGLSLVSRELSASPAVGYLYVHNKEQEILINKALAIGV